MIDRERQETCKKLKATVALLASGLNDMVRTHYVVCVVNRSEDLKDGIGAICTNVGWTNREGNRRPATFATQVVGQLVGGDRKQPAFQRPTRVVVGQAGEKPDESLLHHVLAGGPASQATLHERQQTPFVMGDQVIPRLGLPLADVFDQQGVGIGGVWHR